MYKNLPYALGLQEYVLELDAGICMLYAQRLLFAPPFAVSFPCKMNKRKCVVPENIHTLLPTEGNGNSEGRGVQKKELSEGVRGCFQRFFPGSLSKIGESLIRNSFSVEQAISYFTVTGVALIIFYLRSANAFFNKANVTVFIDTMSSARINFWLSSCSVAVALLPI